MFLWQCVAKYLRSDLDRITDIEQFPEEEKEILSFFGLNKWKEIVKGCKEQPIFVLAIRLQEEEAHGCCDFSIETGKFEKYVSETFKPMFIGGLNEKKTL